MPKTTQSYVRVTSRGVDPITKDGSVTITGLTSDEVQKTEGFTRGQSWIRVLHDGRMEFQDIHLPLPGPTDDEEMLPYWRRAREGEVVFKEEIFTDDNLNHHFPSFLIQSLCGYYYTPEKYKAVAEKLERWGFECLRSRRGPEGRFWEIWFLSDLIFAENELKAAIQNCETTKQKVEKVVSFLCKHSSFGTLDVCVQRAAMTTPD